MRFNAFMSFEIRSSYFLDKFFLNELVIEGIGYGVVWLLKNILPFSLGLYKN